MFWRKQKLLQGMIDDMRELIRINHEKILRLELAVEGNTIRLKRKFKLGISEKETETTKYNDGLDEVRRLNRDTSND